MKKYSGSDNRKMRHVDHCNDNKNKYVDSILAVKNLSISENENPYGCHQPIEFQSVPSDQIMMKRKISWPGPSGAKLPEPDSHLSEITQEPNGVMDKSGRVKITIR